MYDLCVFCFVALMLYAVLEYSFTSAITCVAIFTVGIVSVTTTATHSVHCWKNVHKSELNAAAKSSSLAAARDLSRQTANSSDDCSIVTELKLSTLV